MKRISKAAVLTIAMSAAAFASAGAAVAHEHKEDGGNSATAKGAAIGSPGFLSGNVVQVPLNLPSNECGNGLGDGGALISFTKTVCVNG